MDIFESAKYILVLFGALAAWSLVEALIPLRKRSAWNRQHLIPNLSLTLVTFLTGATMNLGVLAALVWAQAAGFGLFNALQVHPVAATIGAVLALDLAWYVTHLSMHKVPALWPVHVTHHSDPAVDVTTTARQHPFESVLRYAFLISFGIAFGVSPAAFALYRVWSALQGQLEHANIKLPRWLDSGMTLACSSPDFHKIHHSRDPRFTDTNYGNIFSIWDRMFGTFTPARFGRDIDYGLDGYDTASQQSVVGLLLSPFASRRAASASARSGPAQAA